MSCFTLQRQEISQLKSDKQPILFFDKNHTLNAIKLQIEIGNVAILALVDTGAEVSILPDIIFAFINPLLVQKIDLGKTNLTTASNNPLKIQGYFRMPVTLPGNIMKEHNFYVVSNMRGACILGIDFIQETGLIIDGRALTFLNNRKPKTTTAKVTIDKLAIASIKKPPTNNENSPITFQLSHLPRQIENKLRLLFKKHETNFASSMLQLGKTSITLHEINTTTDEPIWVRPFKTPITQRSILKNYIELLLQHGIIRKSTSPYSAPILFVTKKNGELRLCVDFRKLNSVTIKNKFPLPRIEDVFDSLFGAQFFSTLDLFSGFWQIEVKEEDRKKTAFTCEFGHYEFNRLPFGLCNAPASFQTTMNIALDDVLYHHAMVYLDDIIIFSHSIEEHIEHVDQVITLISKAGLKIKPEKCEFAKTEIIYLGHIISSSGIKPNPAKIDSVTNYPPPKDVNQLRTFLGIVNYYRKFIPNFAHIAHPLTKLTRKNLTWHWEKEQIEAFNALKLRLTSAPILSYPDLTGNYILHTDASKYGVGAVLVQSQEGEEKVLAYTSKHLTKGQTKWSTIEKEYYAITHAFRKFYHYLHGQSIIIYTDHKPLVQIKTSQELQGSRIHRFSFAISQFNYEIRYRPGKTNQNADTLSRIPITPDSFSINLISTDGLPSKIEFINAQLKDRYCILLHDAKESVWIKKRIFYEDDLLTKQGKLIVPAVLKFRVMERFHDHLLGGHLGSRKTASRISRDYYWPGMFNDIKKYVKSCVACAKRKAYGTNTAPLKPLEQSSFFWQRVAMDVVGPLPETYQGNRYILVMSEYATRYMIAVPMKNQTARTIAKAFILNVILRYGSPLEILTDRGTNFLSHLLKEICNLLNIKHLRTTAYHPATDGNVERFNRTMGDMLSTALTNDVHIWDEYLPYVIFLYNTSVHASTNETPHYLLFGQDPIEPDDISSRNARKRCIDGDCDDYFKLWRDSIEIAKRNFKKAQKSQKKWYDKGTKDIIFQIGDTVLLRDMRLRSKFKPRWEGPYIVTRKISSLNYAVSKITDSTNTSSTELIVHVNRMKLLPVRDTEHTSNASLTSEEMVDLNLSDWETMFPEEFSLDDLFPDFTESTYTDEDSAMSSESDKTKEIPASTDNNIDPILTPEITDDIDSDKENIDPNLRSTKTRYNLRDKITQPIRYADEFY